MFPKKEDFSVTFEVHLTEETERSIARIFLQELKDTAKGIKSAPGVAYHDPMLKEFPKHVLEAFPNTNTNITSNGSISFSVGKPNLEKGLDVPLA